MERFIGTKFLKAKLMTRLEYVQYRGWDLPENENGEDKGFLVEYLDGGAPNDDRHEGYISWSPAEVFERAYQPLDAMNFSHALEQVKLGKRICRKGWNGKGQWVRLINPYSDHEFGIIEKADPEYDSGTPMPYLAIRTVTGEFIPWLASQGDLLAEDWQIVE